MPFGVLGLAVFGVHLANVYRDGNTSRVQYLFVNAGEPGAPGRSWFRGRVLFALGLWLLGRPDPGLVRALAARWLASGRVGISAVHALLLIPVVALIMLLLGPGTWFGLQAVDGLDVALFDLTLATAALVLIFRSRAWAATLAAAGLLVLGAYGWVIVVFWLAAPGVRVRLFLPAEEPGARPAVDRRPGRLFSAGAGLWLAPRVMHHHLATRPTWSSWPWPGS